MLVLAVLAALALAACGAANHPKSDAPPRTTTTVVQPVHVAGDGILASLDVAQGPHSTIAAVATVRTTTPAGVELKISGDGDPAEPPTSALATEHTIPVVGMRADTTYTLTVEATAPTGERGAAAVRWTTGSLPPDLPTLDVTAAQATAMAPGVTLLGATRWSPEGAEKADSNGVLVALDRDGHVVWYYEMAPSVMEISQTASGTLLLGVNDTAIREIDVLGNTVKELTSRTAERLQYDLSGQALTTARSTPIDVDSTHHEIYQLDDGDLITLSTELIELTDEQATTLCPDNPNPWIVGDVVVELSPDGKVVQEWPLSKVFDPLTRPGAEMCIDQSVLAPPSWFYDVDGGVRDWTHANAVTVDKAHNQLVISLRHLDAVVALRYHSDADGPAGQLLWELGPNGTLAMVGDGTWAYHQHDPELHDDGTMLLFDNGNNRPGATAGDPNGDAPFSRAVLYAVDLEAGTVAQRWQHHASTAGGRPLFSPFLSDADRLPNGNVLVTFGGLSDEQERLYARLQEVRPGSAPDGSDTTTLFDLTVRGTAVDGWTVYRADRLENLYGTGRPAGIG